MFTPKQVSVMLKIPTSSLRRYASVFGDMLSESASQPGKRRLYNDSDLVTLGKIRQLTSSKKTPDEIRALLQVVDDDPPPVTALMLVPEVLQAFEKVSDELTTMRDEIAALRDEIDALKRPWWKKIIK